MKKLLTVILTLFGSLGMAVAPAPAYAPSSACARSSARTSVVICVDAERSHAWIIQYEGRTPRKVMDLGWVITSQYDTDCPPPRKRWRNCGGVGDHITPVGNWRVTAYDPITGDGRHELPAPVSRGLYFAIQFPNATAWNTAVHAMRNTRGSDSHGCVRVETARMRRAFQYLVPILDSGGRIEVDVFRG